MTEQPKTLTLDLSGYLDFRLRPICDELLANGAGAIIIAGVPAADHIKIMSGLAPGEGADALRRIARALLDHATTLDREAAGLKLLRPATPALIA